MTEMERNDIVCALEIAIEQYERDASTCIDQPRVAKQFLEQAERAQRLIEKLA